MKKIVIYVSKTDNTGKIARAIAEQIGCVAVEFKDIASVNLDEFDFVAVGYYIDKGDVESGFKNWLKANLKGKKVGVFMTLGADPDHPHAIDCLNKGKEILAANGNEITHEFFCQGAVSPEMIESMRKLGEMMPNDPRFAVTPEREARWIRASTHPDANDIANAKKAFENL